jgi:hypothetical protein
VAIDRALAAILHDTNAGREDVLDLRDDVAFSCIDNRVDAAQQRSPANC